MVGIVLASHGDLAEGIRRTGTMVFGRQEAVAAVSVAPGVEPETFRRHVESAIASFEDDREVLFLVDLWGGMPFRVIDELCTEHDGWAVVSGLNLPMLVEAFSARFTMDSARAIARRVCAEARSSVRMKPEDADR